MPTGPYSWLSLNTGLTQLAARLSDPSMVFWSKVELQQYLFRALQQFNILTNTWKIDFQFTSSTLWNSLGSIAGSPRLRTATDAQSYTMLQYYLLEPPSGAATWTGTSQFSLNDLVSALQTRRDEMLQVTSANNQLLQNIPLVPNTRRTYLPDTVLDVRRLRYLALQASPYATGMSSVGSSTVNVNTSRGVSIGQLVIGQGIAPWTTVTSISGVSIGISLPTVAATSGVISFFAPNTLYRDDTVAMEWYESPLYQLPSGIPQTFQLSSEPPLAFDVDITPNLPGLYEAVVSQSGPTLNPPTTTVLGIPNDWAFIMEYGALADVLGRESEATDRERSEYCLKRYQDYLGLIAKSPWIMLGNINGAACSVDALEQTDRYSAEWDSNPASFWPVIVTAGIDFLASPVGSSTGVTVLGNAPLLDSTGAYIQVSRDQWDTVLDLAQALAAFKMGGQDWKECMELEQRAIRFCAAENSRLKSTGSFSDVLLQRGSAEDRAQIRYSAKANSGVENA